MIERQIRMTISSFPSLKFIVITTLLKVTALSGEEYIAAKKNSYLMSPIVNFINILRAAFAPIFFYQKL